MISPANYGQLIRYWKNGWHVGKLLAIKNNTAIIKNSVAKRDQKICIEDCEEYDQGREIMSVFTQLFQAAETVGMKEQKPDQSDNEYLISLLVSISKISAETWDALSIPAQAWCHDATPLANKLQQVPNCPGYVGLGQVEKITTTLIPPKGLTATEVFTSPASRFQASQPSSVPKVKKKSTGIMDAVRRTVVIHPEWTSRQVYDYLKLNGYPDAKLDTISVDGGNIRRVIELAKELGLWNDKKEVTEAVNVA